MVLAIITSSVCNWTYGGIESRSTFPKSSVFSNGGNAKPCETVEIFPILACENGGSGPGSLKSEVGVAGALTVLVSLGCNEAIRVSELRVKLLGCLIQSSKGVVTPKPWEWLVNWRCGNGEYRAISMLFALRGSSGLYNSSSMIVGWAWLVTKVEGGVGEVKLESLAATPMGMAGPG